jgi:hypothetical protein
MGMWSGSQLGWTLGNPFCPNLLIAYTCSTVTPEILLDRRLVADSQRELQLNAISRNAGRFLMCRFLKRDS